jgi:hypothetical protein
MFLRNGYSIFDWKNEGKRSLGRRRRILEDNIRMNITEIGWEGVDCCEHGSESLGSIKGGGRGNFLTE